MVPAFLHSHAPMFHAPRASITVCCRMRFSFGHSHLEWHCLNATARQARWQVMPSDCGAACGQTSGKRGKAAPALAWAAAIKKYAASGGPLMFHGQKPTSFGCRQERKTLTSHTLFELSPACAACRAGAGRFNAGGSGLRQTWRNDDRIRTGCRHRTRRPAPCLWPNR